MNRTPLAVAALVAANVLAACPGSDTDRLERIGTIPLAAPIALGGGGFSPYVGVVDGDLGTGQVVRFYRLDAASPDDPVALGGSSLPAYPIGDFVIDGDTAVVSGLDAACVISLAGDAPATPSCHFFPWPVSLAVVDGPSLLAAHEATLRLVYLDEPTGPVVHAAFTAATPVTALLHAPGGAYHPDLLIAFTEGGFVIADPFGFTERSDDTVRRFRRAWADERWALAAGPSPRAGMSRVARIDFGSPDAPTVVRYADLPGEYGDFAWDGDGTSILVVHGEPGAGLYQGYRIREGANGFEAATISLPQWFGGEPHLAAHAGRLFALDPGGMGFYRIH